jgi:hypothetical protein
VPAFVPATVEDMTPGGVEDAAQTRGHTGVLFVVTSDGVSAQ